MRNVREILLTMSPDELVRLLEYFCPETIPDELRGALTREEWKRLFKRATGDDRARRYAVELGGADA